MKAGFKTLNLSLGTISNEQLKRFNRPDVRNSLGKAIHYSAQLHLDSVCYIIVGAPEQKVEDSVSDLLYLSRQKTICGVSVFYPAPGSIDYIKTEKLDLLPENLGLMRFSAIPVSHKTTRLDTITLLRLGRTLNFMKMIKIKWENS